MLLRAVVAPLSAKALISARCPVISPRTTSKGHFSSSCIMTDSTNNPDGRKVPKPSDDSSVQQKDFKPIPDTGWGGETPSNKGGDYETDFMNKPPYKWNSNKFTKKYEWSVQQNHTLF